MGNVYIALHSWFFARSEGGDFLLRIEDSDSSRSDPHSSEIIVEIMNWLNLSWDEKPYFQSERAERYREIVNHMMSVGTAYKCFCSRSRLENLRRNQILNKVKPKYDRRCYFERRKSDKKSFVIRFHNPEEGSVEFDDLIRGRIVFENAELDDLVICRENGTPTYNFCSVVDDLDMRITHVIRGGDHINNTPRQINILRSLGKEIPKYAHLGTLLDEDGGRFSKRKGTAGLIRYRKEGFLPEAITNYLLHIGGLRHDDEVFDPEEIIGKFRIEDLSKTDVRFSEDKLLWYNKKHMNRLPRSHVSRQFSLFSTELGVNFRGLEPAKILDVFGNRYSTFMEIVRKAPYLYRDVDIPSTTTLENLHSSSESLINFLHSALSSLDDHRWCGYEISLILDETRNKFHVDTPTLATLVRIVIIGDKQSPPISEIMSLLGRHYCTNRFRSVLQKFRDTPRQHD